MTSPRDSPSNGELQLAISKEMRLWPTDIILVPQNCSPDDRDGVP